MKKLITTLMCLIAFVTPTFGDEYNLEARSADIDIVKYKIDTVESEASMAPTGIADTDKEAVVQEFISATIVESQTATSAPLAVKHFAEIGRSISRMTPNNAPRVIRIVLQV